MVGTETIILLSRYRYEDCVAKLQFHLKYNGRIVIGFWEGFFPSTIVSNDIIMLVWMILFSLTHSNVVRRICISIYRSHVGHNEISTNSQNGMKWNGNGFRLFSALFIVFYEPTIIQSITIIFILIFGRLICFAIL